MVEVCKAVVAVVVVVVVVALVVNYASHIRAGQWQLLGPITARAGAGAETLSETNSSQLKLERHGPQNCDSRKKLPNKRW